MLLAAVVTVASGTSQQGLTCPLIPWLAVDVIRRVLDSHVNLRLVMLDGLFGLIN